jgi:hypothetical protein
MLIKNEIDELLSELQGYSASELADIRHFSENGEYECALHLIVGIAISDRRKISKAAFDKISDLAPRVQLANPERLPMIHIQE